MQKTDLHEKVSSDYARMLEQAQSRPSGCSASPGPGTIASLAGYTIESQHRQTAGQSFGCGNPLAFADIQPGQTVLDLGCGAGLDLMLAADRVGATGHVIGIDMTQAMVEQARENIERAGYSTIEVRSGMIEHLPVADDSVDWVLSNCVINLAPDKARVFREIARVLKSGGRFSIADIVVDALPDSLRANAALYSACVAGAISEQAYIDTLRAADFQQLAVTDRLVYDSSQLAALVEFEIPGLELSPQQLTDILPLVAGKVKSVKFTGCKP
jgi:ubiquinone/menaquinone biosynthesis C-methylase UbiE